MMSYSELQNDFKPFNIMVIKVAVKIIKVLRFEQADTKPC